MKKEFGGIILNPGCANSCFFCRPKKASVEEVKCQEIDVAKNLREFKRKGIDKIEISGSDPIEYEKIVPLIKFIRSQGIEFVQLSTHGRQLANPKFSLALYRAGLSRLRLPLYGSNASVHDAVTTAKGSFIDTVKGIKWFRKYAPRVEVQISSMITRENKNDLIKLIKLVKCLKVTDFYLSVPLLSNEEVYRHYVPLKDLSLYVKKAYVFAAKINYQVKFMEIPFCVFGFRSDLIINDTLPPDLGKYCQPPGEHRTKIKDLPVYRLKKKIGLCHSCVCRSYCDGFLIRDLEKYGVAGIKPIHKV